MIALNIISLKKESVDLKVKNYNENPSEIII